MTAGSFEGAGVLGAGVFAASAGGTVDAGCLGCGTATGLDDSPNVGAGFGAPSVATVAYAPGGIEGGAASSYGVGV